MEEFGFQSTTAVIMQPTTLCNLDCSYCYLPDRRKQRIMYPTVAGRVRDAVAGWVDRGTVEVCWHGGEPLAAGRSVLGRLMDRFDGLDVVHSVQTNATLITPEWCEFFAERRVRVGVSVDGPPEDNGQRVDHSGRPAFDRIRHGIGRLAAVGLPVSVIAVVSDPTPERAGRLYTFVRELGAAWLGVNIEEREGVNTRRGSARCRRGTC